ncbi:hypothetical protein ABEB36_013746 [Hypothenemus hampei]|uniref:Uncharacterized protein n=1 Tax=Hypothenemus hampei TaxID=57062 RepID=A0ABD1E7W8_HYPHA
MHGVSDSIEIEEQSLLRSLSDSLEIQKYEQRRASEQEQLPQPSTSQNSELMQLVTPPRSKRDKSVPVIPNFKDKPIPSRSSIRSSEDSIGGIEPTILQTRKAVL